MQTTGVEGLTDRMAEERDLVLGMRVHSRKCHLPTACLQYHPSLMDAETKATIIVAVSNHLNQVHPPPPPHPAGPGHHHQCPTRR